MQVSGVGASILRSVQASWGQCGHPWVGVSETTAAVLGPAGSGSAVPESVSPAFGLLDRALPGQSLSLGEEIVPSRFGMALMAFRDSKWAPVLLLVIGSNSTSLPSSLLPCFSSSLPRSFGCCSGPEGGEGGLELPP